MLQAAASTRHASAHSSPDASAHFDASARVRLRGRDSFLQKDSSRSSNTTAFTNATILPPSTSAWACSLPRVPWQMLGLRSAQWCPLGSRRVLAARMPCTLLGGFRLCRRVQTLAQGQPLTTTIQGAFHRQVVVRRHAAASPYHLLFRMVMRASSRCGRVSRTRGGGPSAWNSAPGELKVRR